MGRTFGEWAASLRLEYLAGLTLGCLIGGCSPKSRALPPKAPKPSPCVELAALFTPLVQDHWVASASLALIDETHTEVCSFGEARPGKPATPDTLYEIGSLTKLFTGLLLADSTLRSELQLEEPLSTFGFTLPAPAEGKRAITLLDLATQRSRLPRMPNNLAPANAGNPYAEYDVTRLSAFLAQATPNPAGEQYLYSNLGAAVLGQALARRAGQPYAELVRARLLEPLGMRSTFFNVPASLDARRAQGHDGEGTPKGAWDFDAFAPAGALRSSARDMALFARAALTGARPQTVEDAPFSAAFRLAEQPRADASAGRRIGLFFQTRPDQSVWHNDETGGFSSYFAIDPACRVGVVVLLSSTFARSDELGDRVLAYQRGGALTPLDLPSAFALPSEHLSEYEGEYALSPTFAIRVIRNGDTLFAQATGQEPVHLWASAPDHFYLRAVDAHLEFQRDAAGHITALVLDQGGARQVGTRR